MEGSRRLVGQGLFKGYFNDISPKAGIWQTLRWGRRLRSRVEAGSIGRAFEGEKKLCEPGPKSLGYLEIGSRPLRLSV